LIESLTGKPIEETTLADFEQIKQGLETRQAKAKAEFAKRFGTKEETLEEK